VRTQGPCSCQSCCSLPARYVACSVGTLDCQIRGSAAHPQFQGACRREDEILERARDALQKVGNGFVDAEQIESLRAALDLQAADGDRHKFRWRTPRVFLWSIVLKAFFWIIALIAIAAVVSNTRIDLFDLLKELTGH